MEPEKDAEDNHTQDTRRVFLVRHAESEQNVAAHRLAARGEISALLSLLSIGFDSPLSGGGRLQLAQARASSSSQFLQRHDIKLVAHSPYQRARQTASGLFGSAGVPLIELPFIYEKTLVEHVRPGQMDERIRSLCGWIDARPERENIVVVGHGQFFKRLLGRDAVQANVSALECTFSKGKGFSFVREHQLAPLILPDAGADAHERA
uniref:Phosphoglycerate mutase (2,3-diphosphoglycerate-dependent) n=1 Tax=Chrysotila carterae TaxID=13221 RepID=A0A7S4BA34_CHRCT